MPKIKVPKSVADRFKVTGSGKIMRRKIGARHLRQSKSAPNMRRSRIPQQVLGPFEKKIKKLLAI